MLAVPANSHEAKSIEFVDEMAKHYAECMGKARGAAQKAINSMIDAGIDPSVALQIVRVKFAVVPPQNVGVQETTHQLDLDPVYQKDFIDEEDDEDEA